MQKCLILVAAVAVLIVPTLEETTEPYNNGNGGNFSNFTLKSSPSESLVRVDNDSETTITCRVCRYDYWSDFEVLIAIPTLIQNTHPNSPVYRFEDKTIIYNKWFNQDHLCKIAEAILKGEKVVNSSVISCALVYKNETEQEEKIETYIFADKTIIVVEKENPHTSPVNESDTTTRHSNSGAVGIYSQSGAVLMLAWIVVAVVTITICR